MQTVTLTLDHNEGPTFVQEYPTLTDALLELPRLTYGYDVKVKCVDTATGEEYRLASKYQAGE